MKKIVAVILGLLITFHAWAGDKTTLQVSAQVVDRFEMDRELVISQLPELGARNVANATGVIDPVTIGLPANVRVEILSTRQENVYILAIDF